MISHSCLVWLSVSYVEAMDIEHQYWLYVRVRLWYTEILATHRNQLCLVLDSSPYIWYIFHKNFWTSLRFNSSNIYLTYTLIRYTKRYIVHRYRISIAKSVFLQVLNLSGHRIHRMLTSQILNLNQKFLLHSMYNLMSNIMVYDTWIYPSWDRTHWKIWSKWRRAYRCKLLNIDHMGMSKILVISWQSTLLSI